MKEDDPGKAYQVMKKLRSQPGDCSDEGAFTLISHVVNNLTTEESIEKIAEHFSKISQEFDPIDVSKLSPSLRLKLEKSDEKIPIIEEYQVYKKITVAKKPNSSVPGDLPKKVVKAFAVELAKPLELIFNAITKNAEYPRQWVIEHQTPRSFTMFL